MTKTTESLRASIKHNIATNRPMIDADAGDQEKAVLRQTDAVMTCLVDQGYYLPGAPPAKKILADAQQFAGQLTLALLTCRLMRIAHSSISTPETRGLQRWLDDYIDGKNHGPVGKPMLWPGGLPEIAKQMREWGYMPTEGRPQFVSKNPNPTIFSLN